MILKISKQKLRNLINDKGSGDPMNLFDYIEAEIEGGSMREVIALQEAKSAGYELGRDHGYKEGYYDGRQGRDRRGYCNRDSEGKHIHCVHYYC
jgi:hypothetical protein